MDKGFVGLELLLAALALKGNDRQDIRPGRTKLQANTLHFRLLKAPSLSGLAMLTAPSALCTAKSCRGTATSS